VGVVVLLDALDLALDLGGIPIGLIEAAGDGFGGHVSMSKLFDGVGIKLFDGVPGTGSRVL
jgi:hypothetical protein